MSEKPEIQGDMFPPAVRREIEATYDPPEAKRVIESMRTTYTTDRRAARHEADFQRRVDEAQTREALRDKPRREVEYATVTSSEKEAVIAHVDMLSKVASRPISVVDTMIRGRPRMLVVQRCRACCSEVFVEVTVDWSKNLSHDVRHTYDSHRCVVTDQQLHGCIDDELTEMHSESVRELERLGDWIAKLETAMGSR